jgi:hypothetical protein
VPTWEDWREALSTEVADLVRAAQKDEEAEVEDGNDGEDDASRDELVDLGATEADTEIELVSEGYRELIRKLTHNKPG